MGRKNKGIRVETPLLSKLSARKAVLFLFRGRGEKRKKNKTAVERKINQSHDGNRTPVE